FYPFNSPMDLLRFKPLSFLSRLRLGIVLLYLKKKKNWQKFVNVSAYDWMGKWCGREAMKVIWEPLLLGKFSKYYKEISMAWLWARIHIRANSRARDGEKLGYITGGFDVLTEALQSKLLKQGVIIKKETRVQSIKRDDKTNEVILTFDNGEQRFDKVIVTLPSQVFAGLIGTASVSASYIKKLSSINYLGAVLLVFASDQKLSDYYWHNINDLGAPFLVFLNHTNLVPCSNYNGKYLYYLGTYVPHEHEYFRIGENDLTDIWFRYLKQMFPEFDQKKITEKHLFKFKFAQHVADLDYKNKIPDYRTPIAGVYLANFSQIFPEDRGTNYAVREGKKIAELLRSDLLGKSDLV
ncbi:MAG TPA: FAD-dependent oxidoreductase, partial [Patescibacteria group bacterium]|nr:FAD-dependent oxidoreductase [Patescibacteria group bacterium]